MSSGLDCNDWNSKSKGQEDKVYKKKDGLQYTLDLPMANGPGEVSNYCTMGTMLLGEVIEQSSRMSLDQFAEQYLFTPLGISNYYWGHTSKRSNVSASSKRLYMTTRDFAKVGKLILQGGQWEGRQLVSREWIREALTPKTQISGLDYGFLWWTIPFEVDGEIILGKVATGNGGQYLMLFPDRDLIVVFTGGAYNSPDNKLLFEIVREAVLPYLNAN